MRFLFAPESSARHFQKRRRQPTFVRCPRQWNGRTHHDRSGARSPGWAKAESGDDLAAFAAAPGFRCAQPGLQNLFKLASGNQRKQNADRRGSPCFTFRRSAHPGQGALACRRSTAALARETAGPQGSASGHAFRDSPERSILYGRSNRGAETLRIAMMIGKGNAGFRQDHDHWALPAPEQIPVQ